MPSVGILHENYILDELQKSLRFLTYASNFFGVWRRVIRDISSLEAVLACRPIKLLPANVGS